MANLTRNASYYLAIPKINTIGSFLCDAKFAIVSNLLAVSIAKPSYTPML